MMLGVTPLLLLLLLPGSADGVAVPLVLGLLDAASCGVTDNRGGSATELSCQELVCTGCYSAVGVYWSLQ